MNVQSICVLYLFDKRNRVYEKRRRANARIRIRYFGFQCIFMWIHRRRNSTLLMTAYILCARVFRTFFVLFYTNSIVFAPLRYIIIILMFVSFFLAPNINNIDNGVLCIQLSFVDANVLQQTVCSIILTNYNENRKKKKHKKFFFC